MLADFRNEVAQIKNLLAQAKNILILIRENPSIDGLAGALALYSILKSNGGHATIACPSDLTVEFSDLLGVDEVKKEIGSKNFIISWDYTDGSIEKVSYNIENQRFNLVIQPRENTQMEISKDKISFHRAGLNTDLIFIVQTQNFSLLNNFFTKEQEMFSKVPVINVDNSIENENFGKINLVSPIFGSISELCAELVLELGIKLEKDAATNLLTGIDYCTKNLADNVRPETLEIAAWCLKNGGVRLWKTRIPQDQQNKDVLHKVLKIEDEKKETPPNDVPSPDWLQPKIYHGSTLL